MCESDRRNLMLVWCRIRMASSGQEDERRYENRTWIENRRSRRHRSGRVVYLWRGSDLSLHAARERGEVGLLSVDGVAGDSLCQPVNLAEEWRDERLGGGGSRHFRDQHLRIKGIV